MRGQVVLDTLITAVAIAAAAALILGSFVRIEELVITGIERERAKGTAALLSEWGKGCSVQDVNIDFPYDVNIACIAGAPHIVGGGRRYAVAETACTASSHGKTISIKSCVIRAS